MLARRVHKLGRIWWKKQPVFLSSALQGWSIGLQPDEEDHWNVWFGRLLLGRLESSTASFEPALRSINRSATSNYTLTRTRPWGLIATPVAMDAKRQRQQTAE